MRYRAEARGRNFLSPIEQSINGPVAEPSTSALRSRPALPIYLLALIIGLSVALYMVPEQSIFAIHTFSHPLSGDISQNVIGERYYLHDSWRWPLLVAKNLVTPYGTNVAFMDAIPIILIPLKLFRRFLPPGFHAVFLWLALCWIMQPVAAVFALRSAGERRFLPGLAVAVISVSMPTLLFRHNHSALSSHFLILIALGIYFQIVQNQSWRPMLAGAVLMICSLLVHPYIMYMVMAVLAAAPVTLLFRRNPRWISVGASILGGIAVTGILAVLLGYGHAQPMAGFGYYSMNLLSPVYPYGSSILRGVKDPLDATGGQGEGYQYLGLGVLFMIVLCDFLLGPREKLGVLYRNVGIAVMCVSLTLLALSTRVYAGHELLLSIGPDNPLLQFRTSGRFFWPVAYLLVIGSVVLICRYLPQRAAWAVLTVVAVLQFAETSQMRRGVRHELRTPQSWVLDTKLLRPLLAENSALSIWPKFLCGADHGAAPFTQVELLASEIALPIDTAYTGRTTTSEPCKAPDLPLQVGTGNLVVLLPPRGAAMSASVEDWRDLCRQIGVLVACSQRLRERSDLPLPGAPEYPANQTLSTAAGGAGVPALGFGWSVPEPWGIWSDGPEAHMVLQADAPPETPLSFTIRARGLAPPGEPQEVQVWIDGKLSTVWHITNGPGP